MEKLERKTLHFPNNDLSFPSGRRRNSFNPRDINNTRFDTNLSVTAKAASSFAQDLLVPRSSSYSGTSLVKNRSQHPKLNVLKPPAAPRPKRRNKKMKQGEDRIKMAVRVRPFNDREKVRNAKLIIDMVDNTTIITDPEGRSQEKKFTFDFSYWSHDGYRERADGYLEPSSPRYADQAKVFDDLGRGVLENAWNGFNCSLFAYGQTGSGKSYSMVGYNLNKGIIPITCEELFKGIEEKKTTDDKSREAEYQVSVSMLEIYNEAVKDLLNPASFKKGGLRVRENPKKGFYVEQLQISPVSDYAAVEGKIAEGTRNRTLAATNMNATSSRAHTIVAINFAQKALNEAGKSMTKTSIINLVDLAGSERADSTGATGDRLKEGSNINRSLLCLGNCIKALADVQEGKNVTVPFRDSMLTKLLKNALGGNSKTIMIAALSPADINYEETLSTLRFANRAKAIKTKAVVNESPTDKLIRELKDEIKRLQGLFQNQGGGGTVIVQGISPEKVEEMRRQQEEELLRNQEEMEKMKQTWQERLDEQSRESLLALDQERAKQKARKSTPNLWNLNEDPMLTGMVVHLTPAGRMTIGSIEPAQIILKGLSIQKEHAVINNESNSVIHLTPCGDSKVLVNGKEVSEKTELHHNDRVMFGSNHLYVFHHPQDAAKQEMEGKSVEKVSFEGAQEEIAQNKGFDMVKMGKSKEDMLLQEDLIQIMPMVNEANAMSEELDRKMLYEIALISPQARGLKEGRTEVSIKAKNLLTGNEFIWNRNDFINRRYAMQEMYQGFMEEEENWDKEQEGGYPFRVPEDSDVLIGTAYLYLQSLSFLMDMEDNLAVRKYDGKETGLLHISVLPCSEQGQLLLDDCVEDPNEIVGKNFQFQINIKKILDLPKRFVKAWCRFHFLHEGEWNTTEKAPAALNADINFEKLFKVFPVTKELLDDFENLPVTIQVWGQQNVQLEDPTRSGRSTKELMSMEDSVTLYKPERQAATTHSKAVHESTDMRQKESEIRHLHTAVNDMKAAQQATERENVLLRRENDENKQKMLSMQAKLELITNMVREAQTRGDPTLLVARLDHILRTGMDLPPSEINRLAAQLKSNAQSVFPVNNSFTSNGAHDTPDGGKFAHQKPAVRPESAAPQSVTNPPTLLHQTTFPGSNGSHKSAPSSSSSSSSNSSRPTSTRPFKNASKASKSGVCSIL